MGLSPPRESVSVSCCSAPLQLASTLPPPQHQTDSDVRRRVREQLTAALELAQEELRK